MSEPGSIAPPSDRYLPAVLYGCIPVFAAEGEALPLEEAVDWRDAALRVSEPASQAILVPLSASRPVQITARDIPNLPKILATINASRLLRMRRALRAVWPQLLWPFFDKFNVTKLRVATARGNARPRHGIHKRAGPDAFSALMTVLRRRLGARGCTRTGTVTARVSMM